MVLTRKRCPPKLRNPDDFPTGQLFLLAIVRLAEPIALTSIFPYAWELVKRFHVGNEQDASWYAGLLISSFSLTEALMGMFWGGLSDRVGRKPVLILGCLGTVFSMLMVGFATNIWIALAGRAIGGFLNGNIGVIQTMVAELVTKPEHEPRAYSVMPFVWSIGTIIGPAIGGILADPHKTFPNTFPEHTLFAKYPYLLPNLVCAVLLLISVVMGFFLLEETHPDMQPRVMYDPAYVSPETPLLETSDAMKQPAVDLRSKTYGSRPSIDFGSDPRHPKQVEDAQPQYSVFSKRIMALIAALSIFTYHSMTYDHLFPIFLEDKRTTIEAFNKASNHLNPFYMPGGLGLSTQTVGGIMAVNGIIALFVQAVIFPVAAGKIGIYRLFIAVTMLHPIVYAIVPFLIWAPQSMVYLGIYFCLTVRNLLSIILYPVLLILIKEATPSSAILGKVNGLAASAGAACRMAAPPVAGLLYSMGSKIDCTGIAWYGSALVALVGALQCLTVKQMKQQDDSNEEAGNTTTKQNSGTPGTPGVRREYGSRDAN